MNSPGTPLAADQKSRTRHQVKVLVVDDSSFMRRTITSCLEREPLIHVIGEAENGQQAIELTDRLQPDVITMDLNMPEMDGITAIHQILAKRKVPILVFTSTSEKDGAKVLEALNAGAVDFISKGGYESGSDREDIIHKLSARVLAVSRKHEHTQRPIAPVVSTGSPSGRVESTAKSVSAESLDVVAIAASTGGPVVIESILKELSPAFPLPILIIQHMPPGFTQAFAERLNKLCQITVIEAEDGMLIEPGHAYLAPGGRQMLIRSRGNGKTIRITESTEAMTYRPCVDVTYASVADAYKNRVLAVVLTGMGSDGLKGAEKLKQQGAIVWAQDQASSVVYGMPMAIAKHNLADKILSGSGIGTRLARVH